MIFGPSQTFNFHMSNFISGQIVWCISGNVPFIRSKEYFHKWFGTFAVIEYFLVPGASYKRSMHLISCWLAEPNSSPCQDIFNGISVVS